MSAEINIEWVNTEDLKPHPKNRNKHPDDQISRLERLIKYQGWRLPIIVSRRSGCIVAGHGRLAAAKKMGLKTVPVSYQDFEDDDQEYAFLISDNAISEWAELNLKDINKDLSELDGINFDLDLLGFKDFNLDLPSDDYNSESEDEIPETDENEFGVELGDIWQLGKHKIICGDSTNKKTIEKLLDGSDVAATVTDPPYGIGFKYKDHDDNESDWYDLINKIMPILKDISPFTVLPCCRINSLKWWYENHDPEWIMCWYKGSPGHRSFIGFNDWEPHLTWGRPYKAMHDYWQTACGFEKEAGDHPCPKPVAYAEWLVERAADKNKIIFEPFCGSGTTMIACEKTGRKCYGIELDPHYVSVIIKRWQDYTGQVAKKIN